MNSFFNINELENLSEIGAGATVKSNKEIGAEASVNLDQKGFNLDSEKAGQIGATISAVSNVYNPNEADVGGNMAKQALKWGGMGTKVGSAFGPLGTIIGGGVGALAGGIGGAISAKQMRENNLRERRKTQAMETVNNQNNFRNSYFHLLY